MAAVYNSQHPSMNEPNSFMADSLDLMGNALATSAIEGGLYVQPQRDGGQSFEYHDSDFLSPSYTGPLIESEPEPLLPSNGDLTLLFGLPNNNLGISHLEDMNAALNEDPLPVMPLGDDEIELRATSNTRSFSRFESTNPMSIVSALDVIHDIGNLFLTRRQDEKQVVEIEDSSLEKEPPKSHQPYDCDQPF